MAMQGLILIVEDDKVDQVIITRFFKESLTQYDYVLAATVREAKKLLQKK